MQRNRKTRARPALVRRASQGSLLAELAMSAAMLMIAMALTVKVLGWVGVQQRAWDRRQVAVQEASNLMERLTARPFDERHAGLDAQGAAALSPGAAVAARRPS